MVSLGELDVFLRLGAAVLAGAFIGIDREIRDKPAGLRTITLVSLGSAVFTLTALEPELDATSRVIQGIITGIGFLGAGTIVRGRTEQSIRGLTTAASIWLAAAIGIACALAYWPLVLTASGFGLLVLALEGIEPRIKARKAGTK
jgi:putative Mg2+ transporter-C (MgtC) family protein